MFLPIEKTYVYASDKPWITGKIKSFIAKCRKLLKFGKDSPAYKEARNAVQKECENCKKCFYDRKVAKLKQTNVRRWWKAIKGLTGLRCSESWVQQMLEDHLESTEVLANSFLTSSWLVLLLTLYRCLRLSLVHFSQSLITCWLTHVWYTRP